MTKIRSYSTSGQIRADPDLLNYYADEFKAYDRAIKTSDVDTLIYVKNKFQHYVYGILVMQIGVPISAIQLEALDARTAKSVQKDLKLRGQPLIPHTVVHEAYQGLGIAKSLYSWILDSDLVLFTEGHTKAASRLWDSLAQKYNHYWYDPYAVESKKVLVDPPVRNRVDYYRILSRQDLT